MICQQALEMMSRGIAYAKRHCICQEALHMPRGIGAAISEMPRVFSSKGLYEQPMDSHLHSKEHININFRLSLYFKGTLVCVFIVQEIFV